MGRRDHDHTYLYKSMNDENLITAKNKYLLIILHVLLFKVNHFKESVHGKPI